METYRPPISERKVEAIEKTIAELEEPILNITKELLSSVRQGEFGLLVGEDSAGRIPTLIFTKIFRLISEGAGVRTPETVFVAGSKFIYSNKGILNERDPEKINEKIESKKRLLKSYFESKGSSIGGKKVLLVTEVIQKGDSLAALTEVLDSLGMPYEIASIGICDGQKYDELNKRFGDKLHLGEKYFPTIGNSSTHSMQGIAKEPEDLHSKSLKKIWQSSSETVQLEINKSRELILDCAARIVAKLDNE